MPDGEWKIYHENGQLKFAAMYWAGKLAGDFALYHKNGKLLVKGQYQMDKREGLWSYYYENGNKDHEGECKNGLADGLWNYFYENSGKLQGKGIYRKGKQTGQWLWYYEDGKIEKEQWHYNEDADILFKEFHENGSLKSIYSKVNNIYSGAAASFYEDGKLRAEGLWKDDHEEGFWKFYYPNGNMEAEKEFENGHLKQFATFNENGIIKHLTSYNLSTNGEVLTEHNFFYDEDGKCLYSESDKKDLKHITREIKEKVKYTEKYFPPKGTFVDEIEVKFADGIDVRWKFYKTGELKEKMVMDLVNKNLCHTKKYYQNGQLAAEGEWEPSIPPKKLDGWKYYDENGNPTEPPKEKKPFPYL